MPAPKKRSPRTAPKRLFSPKALLVVMFLGIWAYLYLPSFWSSVSLKVRTVRGDVVTFHQDAPLPPQSLRPAGSWASPLGASDAGLQSAGRGGRIGALLWETETPGGFPSAPAIGLHDRILITCKGSSWLDETQSFVAYKQSFVAYNMDGTLRWRMPMQMGSPSFCWLENGFALLSGAKQTPIPGSYNDESASTLVMADADGKRAWSWSRVRVLDVWRRERDVWRIERDSQSDLHVALDGRIVQSFSSHNFTSWRSDGETLWRIAPRETGVIESLVGDAQGRIFATESAYPPALVCFNREGKLLWKLADPHFASRVMVGKDGDLRVLAQKGERIPTQLYLLRISPKGREIWRSAPIYRRGSSPFSAEIALSSNGCVIVKGSKEIVCLDDKGAQAWNAPLSSNEPVQGRALAVSADGYVYVNMGCSLLVFSPEGRIIASLRPPKIAGRRPYFGGGMSVAPQYLPAPKTPVVVPRPVENPLYQRFTGMALGERRLVVSVSDDNGKGYLAAYALLPDAE